MILDQSAWAQLRVTGGDRGRFLGGMLTSDIAKLPVGGWSRAVMLSVKGRVLAMTDAWNEGDAVILVSEAAWGDKLAQLLDRHAIADDVAFERVQRPLHRVWDSIDAVWTAPPIWAPPPAPVAGEAELELRRIEAGLPRYGIDVSEDHFPFEANLERAIAFDKGCYMGQEVVVRVTTRGGAKKKLLGLRVSGDAPPAAGTKILREGASADAADAELGVITSAARSPVHGVIALGYVHHSAWAPGTPVSVGGRAATVSELPFA